MWITNAGVADWYFVVALTDPERKARGGMTAFIVENWDGVVVGERDEPGSTLFRHPRITLKCGSPRERRPSG